MRKWVSVCIFGCTVQCCRVHRSIQIHFWNNIVIVCAQLFERRRFVRNRYRKFNCKLWLIFFIIVSAFFVCVPNSNWKTFLLFSHSVETQYNNFVWSFSFGLKFWFYCNCFLRLCNTKCYNWFVLHWRRFLVYVWHYSMVDKHRHKMKFIVI